MNDFEFVVLYVESVAESRKFYTGILGRAPAELSPTFLSYRLESGMVFELWERQKVQPAASLTGGTEIGFRVADEDSVKRLFENWRGKGISMAQPPTRMVFGLTFVALDPDGHRLRVFATPQARQG